MDQVKIMEDSHKKFFLAHSWILCPISKGNGKGTLARNKLKNLFNINNKDINKNATACLTH